MSLTEIHLPGAEDLASIPIPPNVERLCAEADRRIEVFIERTQDAPTIAFVPSDFRAAYRALVWIESAHLAAGRTFCEWGSGFGVVAMLAASIGFHAIGIESEPELVRESRALATELDILVDVVQGSFVPEGGDESPEDMMEMAWIDYGAAPAYAELESDPDDFDVIFAYPWPGERHVVFDLFDAHASSGALLLTYNGTEGLCLHRRDRPRRSKA